MSGRQVPGSEKRSGRGQDSAGRARIRLGASSSRSHAERPNLPVSASGRVSTSNASAVVDWLTRSSTTSSQLTSETPSLGSVGSSDTTLSWHAPRAVPVLPLPLSYAVPSPSDVSYALGSAPLFSEEDDQIQEDSQQLLPSQEMEVASLARQTNSDVDSVVGAASVPAPAPDTVDESTNISDVQPQLGDDDDDDDEADRTWEPGEEGASSSSSGEEGRRLPRSQQLRQQGGSSQHGGTIPKAGAGRGRGRGRGRAPAVRQSTLSGGSGAGVPGVGNSSSESVRPGGGKSSYSAVWQFFLRHPQEGNMATCKICRQKVKRGQGPNVGTTALRQHMMRHHKTTWENRGSQGVVQSASSPSELPISASQGSSTSAEGSCASHPSSVAPAPPPPPPSHASRQQSISEAMSKRQQYAPTHPTAQKLNVLLSKLLVLQSLPFQVVESAPFRELMACAEPRWRVPSRHFFAKKAVPALHTFVEQKVGQSLSLSVCSKIHGSADIWSCNYGQGQYMSFTAHWVNVVPLQQQLGQVTPLRPPRSLPIGPVTPCDSASSSSAISSPSTVGSSLSAPPVYHVCRARRCHAVLHMVCLGERSHTGEELLKCIHQEIQTWLTPRKLKMGIMVTDNGKNILSALRQGSLTHAPCMAHVFNLVVKRFLKCSPHLQDILTTSRKLCMHFSHSYTAKHTLLELQRQNGIPQHSLICDVSTRWNSTLHMLDRLYEQRKAITDFLMIQADRGTPLCNFNVNQWQLIRDTCRLLRPFEEATLFVSRQDYGMNDVIPLLHVLQHMLETMAGQGTGDMAFTSYGHMNPVGAELEEEEEEEEEEELPSETQFRLGEMAGLSSQRTGEEEQEQPEELEVFEEGETEDPGTPWQYAVEMETGSPSESLAQMARSMLTCLRSDPRIVSICRRDDFWLSTLLDPRFRHKMGAFFKPTEREDKLNYYKDILRRQLADAYLRHGPYSRRSDSRGPLRSPSTAMAAGGVGSSSSRSSISSSSLSLQSLMSSFLHPHSEATHEQQEDLEQDLNQQVMSYFDMTMPTHLEDPLDFWAAKLDLWPQLAEFALEKLSCPASSVPSERVFSAAGAIVTARRTRLSTKNVERLTFVKMNQGWISQDFHPPMPDACD